MNKKYPHLFSGLKIKNMYLKNRMAMAPMGTFSEERNGFPNNKQINYYRARARGGFGLIFLEGQYTTNKTDPWIDYVTVAGTDEQMKGWSLLAEAVHAEGSKICLQLSCGLGRNAFPFSDDQMVSASEVPSFYFPDRLCRALTIEEIWTSMPVSDFFAFVTAVLILLWYVRRKHLFHPQPEAPLPPAA